MSLLLDTNNDLAYDLAKPNLTLLAFTNSVKVMHRSILLAKLHMAIAYVCIVPGHNQDYTVE